MESICFLAQKVNLKIFFAKRLDWVYFFFAYKRFFRLTFILIFFCCFVFPQKGNTPRIQALKAQDKELAKYLEST